MLKLKDSFNGGFSVFDGLGLSGDGRFKGPKCTTSPLLPAPVQSTSCLHCFSASLDFSLFSLLLHSKSRSRPADGDFVPAYGLVKRYDGYWIHLQP